MSPVLRTLMAKAAPSCGGRSVFSRRNFSSLPGIEGYFGLQDAVDETKAIIQERRDKRKSVGKSPDIGTDNLSSEKNTSETALLKSVGQNNETHSVTS
ncbi:hypothetical protein ISN44_As08g010060 [Arabidopsis suecica]|uniref:Uncharacterized protein n=1 Tax=Arabidopsis suecica TaxID=45249 RepID=A0A8T2BBD0_ARASU|nr:hypothetical protein ISN44_As08g010060 [Arabidopsis suecica]